MENKDQKINLSLAPWQTKVWGDPHRFIVVNCGRRSGKTTMVAWKILDFATKNPKTTSWYVAPTYKQAKNILWEMLSEIIPQAIILKRNETELAITLLNGSRILVKGADVPDSLRGVRIDFVVFDECAFIDKWDLVWKIIRPTLIDSQGRAMFISTPNGFNHFKRLCEDRDESGRAIFGEGQHSYHHYTSYDNPYLDRTELELTRTHMDEDAFEQEIMGEFRKMSGLIYKMFSRELHMGIPPTLDGNWTYTRSIDFGFAHKTALIYFAISPDMTQIWAYDGLYISGFTEDQIAEVVRVKDAGRVITNPVADSSQPMLIAGLVSKGAFFNGVEKGKDSVKNGITKVAEMLRVRRDTGKPTLRINKSLGWIADEFETYRWIQNRSDASTIREIPYKIGDDAMDAVRYMAMSIGDTNEDIDIPDERQLQGWY
jgi:PBSX family phage terminase large subunit